MSSMQELLDGLEAGSGRTPRRIGVLVCLLVAVVVGVVGSAFRIADLGERADANAARDFAERELGGGNSLGVDKEALFAARALIPADEPYRLVLGETIPGATDLTRQGLPDFTRHFLLPRRPSEQAAWVLCYGCDPGALGGWAPAWDGGEGISVGRVGG